MHRRILAGVAIGVALLALLASTAVRLGLTACPLPTIPGTSPWTTARASGLTALLALTLGMVFGLLVATGAADRLIRRGRAVEIHRWLSSVSLVLITIHIVVLTTDRFVRFDLLDVLVPFLSSYRRVAIGVGVLAAYGAVVVHASFDLRAHIGAKTWRKLHYLSFFVFVSAVIHGVFAGSDSGVAGIQVLYVVSATAVGLLVLYRVADVLKGTR
jgi:predicted ferric reductase